MSTVGVRCRLWMCGVGVGVDKWRPSSRQKGKQGGRCVACLCHLPLATLHVLRFAAPQPSRLPISSIAFILGDCGVMRWGIGYWGTKLHDQPLSLFPLEEACVIRFELERVDPQKHAHNTHNEPQWAHYRVFIMTEGQRQRRCKQSGGLDKYSEQS